MQQQKTWNQKTVIYAAQCGNLADPLCCQWSNLLPIATPADILHPAPYHPINKHRKMHELWKIPAWILVQTMSLRIFQFQGGRTRSVLPCNVIMNKHCQWWLAKLNLPRNTLQLNSKLITPVFNHTATCLKFLSTRCSRIQGVRQSQKQNETSHKAELCIDDTKGLGTRKCNLRLKPRDVFDSMTQGSNYCTWKRKEIIDCTIDPSPP